MDGFEASPAGESHRTGNWVELWIPDTPDETFRIVPELKEQGFTHYLSMPTTAMGMKNSFSFATREPDGFSPEDMGFLNQLIEAGKVKPVIDKVYPMSKAKDAFWYLERDHAQGKVVLTIDH